MRLIQSFFVIFLLSLATVATAQNLGDINFQTTNIDNLSEQQISRIYQASQARGLSVEQTVQLAVQQGLPPSQASALRQRLNQARSGMGQDGGAQEIARNRDALLQDFNQVFGAQTDVDSLRTYGTIDQIRYITRRDSILLAEQKMRDKIFGYNLFQRQQLFGQQAGPQQGVQGQQQGQGGQGAAFQPIMNIPTPTDYVLGSGDQVFIDVWGAHAQTYQLQISPEGNIMIPNLGPIYLDGLTIEDARQKLYERMSQIYTGLSPNDPSQKDTYMQVSLGQSRSITVTVIGEAAMPGTYTIPSFSTVLNLLYVTGGPSVTGSFRKIDVIRGDSVAVTFDLYDLLVNGDRSDDIRLRSQDLIRVHPYIDRVEVSGEVKRPGIYEMQQDETLADLIEYTGGFTDQAYQARVRIVGNTPTERQVADVGQENFANYEMASGDSVHVGKVLDRFANAVTLNGAVYRPGQYQVTESTTLYELIQRADGLREDAFMSRALIYREQDNFELEAIQVNLRQLMQNPEANDIALQPRDQIRINSIFDMREDWTIRVSGPVMNPSELDYVEGMTLEDAIFRAGGFTQSAAPYQIEVARRIRDMDQSRTNGQIAETFQFSVDENLEIDEQASRFTLQPYDRIYVRELPNYENQQEIRLVGEVQYPGAYSLSSKTDRISDLIERAGGLTSEAYLEGAALFRRQENIQQQTQAAASQQVTVQGGEDITVGGGQGQTQGQQAGEQQLQQQQGPALETKQQVGINLAEVVDNPGSRYDLYLEPGDSLFIPRTLQTVRIQGGVFHETSVRFSEGSNFMDYITQAGGYSNLAREGDAYVIYANGEVGRTKHPLAIFRNYPDVKPGATIMVPQKPEAARLSPQERVSLLSAIISTAALLATTITQLSRR
ncbi:MAG: SLBB domain-containing protein [Balneolaceae bacterium]|nr:SLBB domain-containing protein [Balneolaceae bacterium]